MPITGCYHVRNEVLI